MDLASFALGGTLRLSLIPSLFKSLLPLGGIDWRRSEHPLQGIFKAHRMQHDRFVVFFFWHVSTVVVQSQTLIVSTWTRDAEAAASSDASASCYGVKEDVGIFAIVEAPRKLIQIQGQVFSADVVIGADDPALQKRPETLNRISMNPSSHVFAPSVVSRNQLA
jgi:hypothetical protein